MAKSRANAKIIRRASSRSVSSSWVCFSISNPYPNGALLNFGMVSLRSNLAISLNGMLFPLLFPAALVVMPIDLTVDSLMMPVISTILGRG